MDSRPRLIAAIATLAMLLALPTFAQVPPLNVPPAGAYSPIPNFVGTDAGLLFRNAVNDRFSGVQPTSPRIVEIPFASLPAEGDGLLAYCTDCQKTNPCVGGGSGAWAFGQNGAWSCTAPNGAGNALSQGQPGAQLGDLSAVAGGTSSLAQFNVNGVLNAMSPQFNASGSLQATTGSIAQGSNQLTVVNNTFKVGQGISVSQAGASNTAANGTAFSSTAHCSTFQTVVSCSNTLNHTYNLAFIDANKGLSAASGSFTCVGAPGALNEANYCTITWMAGANAVGVLVYRDGVLIGPVIPASDGTYNDVGNGALQGTHPNYPTTPPSAALAGPLVAKVIAINGNVLTLDTYASNAATTTPVIHDDTAALQAWIAAVQATNGTKGFCPTGSYLISGKLTYTGANGLGNTFEGPQGTGRGPSGCHIIYDGVPGQPVFYANGLNSSVLKDMSIDANGAGLYAVQVDNSDGNHASSGAILDNMNLSGISGQNSVDLAINHSGCGSEQVSEVTVRHTYFGSYGVPGMGEGFKTFCGNNTKDFALDTDSFVGLHNVVDWAAGSGRLEVISPQVGNETGTDFIGGTGTLKILGGESEGDGLTGNRFVTGTCGSNAGSVEVIGYSWESAAPSDNIAINYGCAFTMSNSRLQNGNGTGQPVQVRAGGKLSGASSNLAGGLISENNFYQFASGLPPFYDGSGNHVVDFLNSYPFAAKNDPPWVRSQGDTGGDGGNLVALKPIDGFQGDELIDRAWIATAETLGIFRGGINAFPPTHQMELYGGQAYFHKVADPVAGPSVTPNTVGTTSYSYYLVFRDAYNGKTRVSPATTIANGAATPNNSINAPAGGWPGGAYCADILRGDTSHSVAVCVTALPYTDTASTTTAYTAPTANATADFTDEGGGQFSSLAVGNGPDHVAGHLLIDTSTSTNSAPSLLQFNGAGNGAYRIGDAYSGFQSASNFDTQFNSYWTLELYGHQGGFPAFKATGSNDPAVRVYPPGFGTGPTMAWVNSAGATLSKVGVNGEIVPPQSTVGSLPACNSTEQGAWMNVTDSTSLAAEGQSCAGGSTNYAAAFCNGTTWKCF